MTPRIRLVIQLATLACCLWISEFARAANGAAAGGLEGLVVRYGPWGVVAVLLSASIWTQKRLVNNITSFGSAFARLVEILSNRPCVTEDRAKLRELLAELQRNNGDGG